MIWTLQEHSLVMHENLKGESDSAAQDAQFPHQCGEQWCSNTRERKPRNQAGTNCSQQHLGEHSRSFGWSPELDDEILVLMKTRITPFSFALFKNSSVRNDPMIRFINNLWVQSKFWLSSLKDNLNSIVEDSALRNKRKECYISANEIELAWPRQRQFYFRHYNSFFQFFTSRKMNLDVIVWSGELWWTRETLSVGRQSRERLSNRFR